MFGRPKSDVELIRASLDGNMQAFEVVVGRYQSLVCAITYSATGDVGRSEELAQEAFLRAWKSLGQLQDLGKFRAWLCSIARSTVQNWFRSAKRDVVGRAVPLDVAAEEASRESGPEEAVMIEEQQAVVRQALAGMPEGLREPLVLFYREGKSTREVAELLGLSENATRQRISRGRSLLREQVADMVEATIARTKPGKAFTTAVVVTITGLGIKGSATAVAAAGGSSYLVSIASSLTAKVAAVAVGAVIVAGGIIAYNQRSPVPGLPTQAQVQAARSEPSTSSAPPAEPGAARDAADGAAGSPEAPAAARETLPDPQPAGRDRRAAAVDDRVTPFEFKAQGVLSGRITDIETGEPVRDARLMASMSRIYTTKTDANGFYCIEKIDTAGDFRVSIVSQEYVGVPDGDRSSVVHLSPDKQMVKHFQLPRACMVDVWVVDANGVGIKDAKVVGTSLADARRREINSSPYAGMRTDPNGYILLGGFPPAETDYLITTWHSVETGYEQRGNQRYARSECDHAPGRVAVRLNDPNVVRQVQIVLEPGLMVQARAEYEDGQPAADADIRLEPSWWHTNYILPGYKTAGDGTFTIKHIATGLYKVSFSTPMTDAGSMSRKIMDVQLPLPDDEPLVVRLPGKSPQSWVSITGTLTFRGEKKPSYVRIEGASSSGQSVFGNVDYQSGGGMTATFSVERLEPGTYTLTFSGDDIEEITLPNVVAPSSDLQVELVHAPKPKLTGAVVDARTGAPIQDFRVRVRKLRTLRGSPYVQSNQWVHYENERGEFSLDTTGPGVYQVQAVAAGYAPSWSSQIDTDSPTQTAIALSAGGAISGRVVNERGELVGGAKIIPLSLAGGTMSATEDVFVGQDGAVETADGLFTLRQVPPGTETLKVMHPGYASQVVPEILVTADRTTEGVEVVLTSGGTIEGYVYDLQGKPQAAQVLYVQDAAASDTSIYAEAGRLGQAVTDANGFYRVEHLPRRLCHVQRIEESQGMGVVCRAVVPRAGQVVRVDLGGVPVVRGRLVIDGVPQAKTKLMIGVARLQYSGAFRCYAITDGQGNFTFGGAPSGTYSIHYERSAESPRWLPVGTVTVGNGDVDAGTLPACTSSVLVALNQAGAGEPWPIESVSLTTGPRLWSTPAGIAAPPSKPGGPYILRNIEPGRYVLNVRRQDQVYWQKWIDLDPGKSQWELSLDLPVCRAGVSGSIRGSAARIFVLWREQKDVCAILTPEKNGAYRVERLPAGRYWIGDISCALYHLPPMAEFSLGEDEKKTLDLDLSAEQARQTGFVLVQTVDEGGLLCEAAQIRLEGPLGPAEPVQSEDTGQGPGFLTVPGAHTLRVTAPGYRDVVQKVRVRPFDPHAGGPQTLLVCLDRK